MSYFKVSYLNILSGTAQATGNKTMNKSLEKFAFLEPISSMWGQETK